MRRETGKKLISVAMAFVMASAALASCSSGGQANDEILDLSKSALKNIVERKISKLAKISTSAFDDVKKDWSEELDFSAGSGRYTNEYATVFTAISDTIDYSIDEDSVESSTKYGEGRVRVEFTIADYEALFDDEEAMNDADSFVDALHSCSDKDIELWLDFEMEGETWLLSNPEEILNTLYSFREKRIVFVPDLTRSSYGVQWFYTDDYYGNTYTNTSAIDCELVFYDNSDSSSVYYTVSYEGSLLYTSPAGSTDAYYTITDSGAPLDPERGTLATGEYTVTFYDGSDSVLEVTSCTVVNTVPSPGDYILWYSEDESWGTFAIYDDAYMIDPDLNISDLNGYSNTNYYYTVTFRGEEVYVSSDGEYMGYYYSDYQDSGNFYLDPGVYEVAFYDAETEEHVVTAYAVVLNDGVGADGTYLGAFLGLNVIGMNVPGNMYNDFLGAYWYSDSGEGSILTGANTLTYRIPVTEDYGTLDYTIIYSEDGDESDPYSYVTGSDHAEVQYDEAGNMFYEFTYDGTVEEGYYRITVMADNAIDFSLFSVCQVQ